MAAASPSWRPTWAEVDLGAVAHNVALLREHVAPAALCAVVKAGAYGHGAVAVARAALGAGAACLAVALVEEGEELREAGIDAPVLLLSQPPAVAAAAVPRLDLEPTVDTPAGVAALSAAAVDAGSLLRVHVKADTGMHRVGAAPNDVAGLVAAVAAAPGLELASVWTHLAVADEPDDPFTDEQLDRFDDVLGSLPQQPPLVHAANSAGALAHPRSRFDMVRCGIAVYGIAPGEALHGTLPLRPALRLVSQVTHVKRVEAGETLSYGRRYRLDRPSHVATVPIGYADGLHRRLGAVGGEVLVAGRRRPIAGTVTMDQITVDLGDDATVQVGDEVVLLGAQGDEVVTADEWADLLDTIAYEIVCDIGPRVPRRYPKPSP